jgi:hypothetical protein
MQLKRRRSRAPGSLSPVSDGTHYGDDEEDEEEQEADEDEDWLEDDEADETGN